MLTKKTSSPLSVFALQSRLRQLTGKPLVVQITLNRSSMLSYVRGVVVRAHRMFLHADEPMIAAIAEFLLSGKRRACMQKFIEKNYEPTPARPRTIRERRLCPLGNFYDLREIAAPLNQQFFNGASSARLTWGKNTSRRRVRSLTLGYFSRSDHLITLNRRLDSPRIPRFFVEYVLYHEMLHEVLGIGERPDGRRDIHGKNFSAREKLFPFYREAIRFEKEQLLK